MVSSLSPPFHRPHGSAKKSKTDKKGKTREIQDKRRGRLTSAPTRDRPKSKYAEWEDPPQEGEPFNYDAVPNRFYFEVESAGSMAPDQIVQVGIRTLQQKIGALLKSLDPKKYGGEEADLDRPRSPDMAMEGGTTPWGQDGGYATPYGGNTAYGAGGGTAYGMTPYGQTSWQ